MVNTWAIEKKKLQGQKKVSSAPRSIILFLDFNENLSTEGEVLFWKLKGQKIFWEGQEAWYGCINSPIMSSIKGCWKHMSGCLIHRCISANAAHGIWGQASRAKVPIPGSLWDRQREENWLLGVQKVSLSDLRVQIRNKNLHMQGPFTQYLLSSYWRLAKITQPEDLCDSPWIMGLKSLMNVATIIEGRLSWR